MKRIEPEKRPATPTYRQVWRVVDGAVALALSAHPEYIAPGKNPRTVRNSIVKRVVGAIVGYQSEKEPRSEIKSSTSQEGEVRSEFSPADEEAGPSAVTGPAADGTASACDQQSE